MMGNTLKKTTHIAVDVTKIERIENVLDTVPEAFTPEISKDIDYNYYIQEMAKKLKVEYIDLFTIIAYETGGTFDPKIRNKESGAMGLIQFQNSTAKTLLSREGTKFHNVYELIQEYPTVKDQMELPSDFNPYGGPVYQYLSRNMPYENSRKLYLTVFYPVAIKWDDNKMLPAHIRRANPGLNKVGDYPKIMKTRLKFSDEVIYD